MSKGNKSNIINFYNKHLYKQETLKIVLTGKKLKLEKIGQSLSLNLFTPYKFIWLEHEYIFNKCSTGTIVVALLCINVLLLDLALLCVFIVVHYS